MLILPLGMIVGLNYTALPFLLAKAGLSVDRIAIISSIINLPGVLGLIVSPIVDIKLRRRTWLAIGTFGTAIAACVYFPLIGGSHTVLMTALVFAGGMVTFLVVAACGGLMVRILSLTDQPKAGAWTQVGVLGGGALSGAIVLWLSARMSMVAAGFCFGILVALLGPLAFTIDETAPLPSPWFHGRFATIGKEIWGLASSRPRRWGTLLLLSPYANWCGAKFVARHRLGLRGWRKRRYVDQWARRGRCVGTWCVGQHADSWHLGPPSHVCRIRGHKRARRTFPARSGQTVGVPRRYVLLLSNARSVLGTERGSHSGDCRTGNAGRQHVVLSAERCGEYSGPVRGLARWRRLSLLWYAWVAMDRSIAELRCVRHRGRGFHHPGHGLAERTEWLKLWNLTRWVSRKYLKRAVLVETSPYRK